jgi:hypothetical protein
MSGRRWSKAGGQRAEWRSRITSNRNKLSLNDRITRDTKLRFLSAEVNMQFNQVDD